MAAEEMSDDDAMAAEWAAALAESKPEPVGGSYWAALVTFDFGRLVWGGGRALQVPHWTAILVAATLPVARFIGYRRRRRRAGGFPVAAMQQAAS